MALARRHDIEIIEGPMASRTADGPPSDDLAEKIAAKAILSHLELSNFDIQKALARPHSTR